MLGDEAVAPGVCCDGRSCRVYLAKEGSSGINVIGLCVASNLRPVAKTAGAVVVDVLSTQVRRFKLVLIFLSV
jgi:hypothetical protein